jgi:hypothetical protein
MDETLPHPGADAWVPSLEVRPRSFQYGCANCAVPNMGYRSQCDKRFRVALRLNVQTKR